MFGPDYERLGAVSIPGEMVRPSGMFLDEENRILALNAYWSNRTVIYKF